MRYQDCKAIVCLFTHNRAVTIEVWGDTETIGSYVEVLRNRMIELLSNFYPELKADLSLKVSGDTVQLIHLLSAIKSNLPSIMNAEGDSVSVDQFTQKAFSKAPQPDVVNEELKKLKDQLQVEKTKRQIVEGQNEVLKDVNKDLIKNQKPNITIDNHQQQSQTQTQTQQNMQVVDRIDSSLKSMLFELNEAIQNKQTEENDETAQLRKYVDAIQRELAVYKSMAEQQVPEDEIADVLTRIKKYTKIASGIAKRIKTILSFGADLTNLVEKLPL